MKHFSGKDKKQLNQVFPSEYQVDKKDELVEFKSILFKNKEHFLIQQHIQNSKEFEYVPHLKSKFLSSFKTITIDVGAVPFLLNGADMMRPGIVNIDEGFEKDDLIIIVDEVKQLRIGIGKAMFSSDEMKRMDSGKVVKTLHYFKDEYYEVNL